MPTAAEHRAEASSLARALDTVRAVRSELVRDRDDLGVRGGTTHLVRWSIGASVDDLDLLGRLVFAVVDELHRRAAACDRFTAAVQQYEHAHRRWTAAVREHRVTADSDHPARWPGPEPHRPVSPFPGAVAG
jgi:hypothetical protein